MVRAIAGANWGDEEKGKITDMLVKESDITIRSQGGGNAGHTIINDYGEFALHLPPSDVFYQRTTSIIDNDVASNIPYLVQGIESLVEQGVPKPRVLVSNKIQTLVPYHVLFDTYEEARLTGKSFGSTKSGITPFYSDKCVRIDLQISELFDQELLREKTYRVCEPKSVILKHLYHKPPLDPEEIIREPLSYRDTVEPYVCDTSAYLHEVVKEGKKVLLEDQLGSLKDPDHGIYLMVTPSSALTAYRIIDTGIPPYKIEDITTVVKAYSSAVGTGAFVSEILKGEVDGLRNRGSDGGEYGVITGRPRRVGWFDTVTIRYGCRIQGTTEAAFIVLDVLGYLDKVPVCAGYEIGGQVTRESPTTARLEKTKSVLTRLPGQKCDICGIRKYGDLPEDCRKYIEFVERGIETPILTVSSGPGGDGIIIRK